MRSAADTPSASRSVVHQLVIAATVAVISAFAAAAVVQFRTPVDDALPVVAVALCVVAAVSSPVLTIAVPLLMAGEIAIPDERTRLLWFGLVTAAALAAALIIRPAALWRAAVLTVVAVVLLRWIPLENVEIGREIVLLLFALAITAAFGSTALAVAAAVATALFTPLIPLRTLWIPLAVLFAGMVVLPVVALRRDPLAPGRGPGSALPQIAGASAVAVMVMFFAWSGVFARALPLIWKGFPRPMQREVIRTALAAGESIELDVPAGARALIVSGANVSRFARGTVVGRIDPGGKLLKIGEVVDWGSLRPAQYYNARNGVPRNPAGQLRDYGYSSWIDGAARVAIPPSRIIRVTADGALPPNARLQVEAFDLESR